MLLLLAEYLQQFYKGFAVFQYLTLRGILGVLTALSLSLWLGPWMIRTLQNRQIGQSVRNDGPQSHLSKSGTPTMGGALILSAIAVSTLLWADRTVRARHAVVPQHHVVLDHPEPLRLGIPARAGGILLALQLCPLRDVSAGALMARFLIVPQREPD